METGASAWSTTREDKAIQRETERAVSIDWGRLRGSITPVGTGW